jgi:hypothetical protein
MKRSIRKCFTLILIFTLILSISFPNPSFAKSQNDDEFTILVNNDKKIQIKTERDGIQGILKFDKETKEISLKTNEKSKNTGKNETKYKVEVDTATEEKIEATFINVETGEEYDVNTDELQASFAFLIPIGIVIGEALIAHLIAIGLALVISGVTYIAYTEFIKKKRTYSHYMATRQSSGIFIGNGLSASKATSRLKSGGDTWSNSSYGAKGIAKNASPYLKTLGAEIDKYGSGKHYHYHPVVGYTTSGISIRGAHAFYGAPRQ